MPDQDLTLLQTKLHRPRLPNDLVERSRLVELLDHDLDRPLTLVCAPAGFGKTTLVSTWLERMAASQKEKIAALPSAWVSLDENDSDLTLFLRYFIAAIRTIFEEACEGTLILLRARRQPPQATIFTTFFNELEQLPGEVILVLDDYHTIHGTEVHMLMSELVRHWPRPLHLVLVTRISPPLPLSSIQVKGMLVEIRTRDLRFTLDETVAYMNQSHSALLSQDALPLLEERFEGWIAGLHLATLSLRSAGSPEAVLSALSSENANITAYLVDEVLSHQFPAIYSFLLKTSILDRLCVPLCEAVVGERDAAWGVAACLDWIERSELFLIPLDDRREWYRYHHLFQELLQQRLSAEMKAEEVNQLHLEASVWYEGQGLIDEALHHALAAGDLDLAAHQMSAGLQDVLDFEDRPTLERWLRLLPEELIQRKPGLLMVRAWALEFVWMLDQQAQVLQQVEELLETEAGASLPADELQILRGHILMMKAQQAYFGNQPGRAIDLCRQAMTLVPPEWKFVHGAAMLYMGMAMQASGQSLEAERLLLAEYESARDKTNIHALFLLLSLCFISLNTGRPEQTRRTAQLHVQQATQGRVAVQKYWGEYFLGVVHYLRNELEASEQHFRQIVENRYTAQITAYRDAVAGIALIHQIQGEWSEALRMVESISRFDLEQSGSEDMRTRSLRARLLLLQGDLEGAGRWGDTFKDLPQDQPLLWLEEPQVTRARILVARGTDDNLHLAMQTLGVLEEVAERTHNTRYKIELLALRALALDAQGETGQADAVLNQALDLARSENFIRIFIDLGQPMEVMLERLAKQDHSAEAIRRILAVFPEEDKDQAGGQNPEQGRRLRALTGSLLVEHLTPRELEVLTLLRGQSSIKEISRQLHISYATAKRHTINIYAKLGVNRRWDAVARAEELNILPPA